MRHTGALQQYLYPLQSISSMAETPQAFEREVS